MMKFKATMAVYRDRKARWRWSLVHRNGNVLADSGQSYGTRSNALRSALRLVALLAIGPIDMPPARVR